MTGMEKVSMRLAQRLKTEEMPYSVGTLAHGIEIFLFNLVGLVAICLGSFFLNLFKEVIFFFAFFYFFRTITGGVHLRSPWTCLLATLVLMLAGGFLIKHFPLLSAPYAQLFILAVSGLSFGVNYRHAPAAHTYAPDKPAIQQRNRLMILIMILIGCTISIILVGYTYQLSMTYTFAILLQSVLLMPSSFRLLARLEKTI
ncbi:accessory gene regulator ArgB-like protein [Brevibacillus centrosporus]|uniref:Accessory gene regulator protein AgrB n=1 Tax=Brevibacillus centrosporus TaxID=54910 RepID=A0A1I4CIJ2_9BACL|nr:accessory gene regulator B family protein [Brevibacillus centrosporus]SFK81058.1 Accessory gene regulator protein AgrB [Brevibacillus centrosporus]